MNFLQPACVSNGARFPDRYPLPDRKRCVVGLSVRGILAFGLGATNGLVHCRIHSLPNSIVDVIWLNQVQTPQ
jgi:hypothetical protein